MVTGMVVSIKDAAKLSGIVIIACCAVLVCTLFLNFNLDIAAVRGQVAAEALPLYEAQVSTGRVVSAVSGGCLLLTSVVMLLFYIRHYIDSHKKQLGILKAMGYSSGRIARHFWVFGASVFLGAAAGFAGAFGLMPTFYRVQNAEHMLPDYTVRFHSSLAMYLVLLPTAFFALLAVGYAYRKLRAPVMALLYEMTDARPPKRAAAARRERPFLRELRSGTLRRRKTLVFFMAFASFCYAAMTQMSVQMKDLSSVMMAVMMLLIGLVLAFTTLFLGITTVARANAKSIAMMRVFGYRAGECAEALLGGYRPAAYIGFAVGTVYQYVLLRVTVTVVFRDVIGTPDYPFDWPAALVSALTFTLLYEGIMRLYAAKMRNISVKEIMLE